MKGLSLLTSRPASVPRVPVIAAGIMLLAVMAAQAANHESAHNGKSAPAHNGSAAAHGGGAADHAVAHAGAQSHTEGLHEGHAGHTGLQNQDHGAKGQAGKTGLNGGAGAGNENSSNGKDANGRKGDKGRNGDEANGNGALANGNNAPGGNGMMANCMNGNRGNGGGNNFATGGSNGNCGNGSGANGMNGNCGNGRGGFLANGMNGNCGNGGFNNGNGFMGNGGNGNCGNSGNGFGGNGLNGNGYGAIGLAGPDLIALREAAHQLRMAHASLTGGNGANALANINNAGAAIQTVIANRQGMAPGGGGMGGFLVGAAIAHHQGNLQRALDATAAAANTMATGNQGRAADEVGRAHRHLLQVISGR